MPNIIQQSQELWFNSRTPELSWLSNFHPVDIEVDGITYPSVENMYQAHKFPVDQRHLFCDISAIQAKTLGSIECPETWNKLDKLVVMRIGLRIKFSIQVYREMLESTGNSPLIHLSPWDLFWGMNKEREGKNIMGNMLMELRENNRLRNVF